MRNTSSILILRKTNLEPRRNATATVDMIPQKMTMKYPKAWLPPGLSKSGVTPAGGSIAGPSGLDRFDSRSINIIFARRKGNPDEKIGDRNPTEMPRIRKAICCGANGKRIANMGKKTSRKANCNKLIHEASLIEF